MNGLFAPPKRPGKRLGIWFDDHWPILVQGLGTAIVAACNFLKPENRVSMFVWWAAFLLGCFALIFGGVLSFDRKKRITQLEGRLREIETDLQGARSNSVFVVIRAFTESWQAELEHQLLVALSSKGLRPTMFVPTKEFDFPSQRNILEQIISRREDYAGGIIIPSQPEEYAKNFFDFAEKFGRSVVFADNVPFTLKDRKGRTAWVGMSSEEGGRLAAELLIEFLDGANTEKTVLIVAGKSQVKRQEEFMKRLSDETAWKVIPNADGKFSRTRAREIVEGWLSGDSIPDAIFCTCDSMTLGCLDALNNNKKKGSKVMVIGYDGIPETLQLVRDRRSPLRGLVEQDPERVAVEAAHMLAQLISTVELNEQFEPAKLLKPNRVPESGWRDNTRKSTP